MQVTVQLRERLNVDALLPPVRDRVRLALEVVGTQLTAWARSHTSALRPPARRSGPWRPAHPSPLNWADVKGQLAASYYHQVTPSGDGWKLDWGNTAEHAVYVEARDGFAVVSGVIEPDGAVVPFLTEALEAMGFTVVIG